MSELKPLVIGDLVVEKPIIQGGMGVGISLHRLAGAVAKAGGMGIISAAQIGFREPDFTTNFVEANLRSIRREIFLYPLVADTAVHLFIINSLQHLGRPRIFHLTGIRQTVNFRSIGKPGNDAHLIAGKSCILL